MEYNSYIVNKTRQKMQLAAIVVNVTGNVRIINKVMHSILCLKMTGKVGNKTDYLLCLRHSIKCPMHFEFDSWS